MNKTHTEELQVQSSEAVIEKSSETEIRKRLSSIEVDCEPRAIIRQMGEMFSKYDNGTKKEQVEARKTLEKRFEEVYMIFGLETNYPLAETVDVRYRPLILEATRGIQEEYKCRTPSERALAEVVGIALLRIIDNSRRLNNELGAAGSGITENKTKYATMLSKQLDRANRQFLNALLTLKQLKAPNIEMNIKAKTAYIAQNQQINESNAQH